MRDAPDQIGRQQRFPGLIGLCVGKEEFRRRIGHGQIEIEPLPTRRQKRQNESYRIGRTIAGEAFSDERKAKLERLKERKKTKRKNVGIVLAVLLLVALVGIVIGHYVSDIMPRKLRRKFWSRRSISRMKMPIRKLVSA